MAPHSRPRGDSIDRTAEYEEFIANVAAFYTKRGTNFDPEPRLGSRRVDLLRLFKEVVSYGGYDAVSVEKLLWRKIGLDFGLGNNNLSALAFSLKSIYYKNLAAYELATVHGKDPPPPSILEHLSARGADLLNRTVENFKPRAGRERGHLANGEESEEGEDSDGSQVDDQRTPKADTGMARETPTGGRSMRGLRQAPLQRVPFQPDMSSGRQRSHASTNLGSPHAGGRNLGGISGNTSAWNSLSMAGNTLDLTSQVPLSMNPVITPGNNPRLFRDRQRALREARYGKTAGPGIGQEAMLMPGRCFEGPNIYVRTLLALRSGIPKEQDYALHHLVKISHERGDKFKFEAFPGLAEALIERILDVISLFYGVAWQLNFGDDKEEPGIVILNGVYGTSNIMDKISGAYKTQVVDDMQTEEFSRRLSKSLEACLVLRNMAMLEENAAYLSGFHPARDFICIALNLPCTPAVIELQHYALEVAEQLTRFSAPDPKDPLYRSLLAQLEMDDRGRILGALRAISRISLDLEESNRLQDIPISALQRIYGWTLLEDEELLHASLDFLYQFTAVYDNVELMLGAINMEGLISQLVRFLLYKAKMITPIRFVRPPPNPEIRNFPPEFVEQFLEQLEPERSSRWLRAVFEEDPDSDVTQISLWHAYQTCFRNEFRANMLLPAQDFIKNVSLTFNTATAQIFHPPSSAPTYIVKGIRWRRAPVDPSGRLYQRCQWRVKKDDECGIFQQEGQKMWEHIIEAHLHGRKKDDGKWDLTSAPPGRRYMCHWANCSRFAPEGTDNLFEAGMHMKIHFDTPSKPPSDDKTNEHATAKKTRGEKIQLPPLYITATDEAGVASGLPLTAALILRNLARNLPRVERAPDMQESWTERLFRPVEKQLWFVMAHNKPLVTYMADLIETIDAGKEVDA